MATTSEHEQRFIARIRKLREYRGMSCQRLADASGMSRVALSKVENSDRGIALGEAVRIAAALGVPLQDMCSPEPLVLRIETTVE